MEPFGDVNAVEGQDFDIVIVGGGINGTGIARDAALRGLDVILLEKDDFASGTSSSSTKLAHGGLRYLEQYEFGLVFEALRERKILLEIAPHLVKPEQFLFPIYDRSRVPAWQLKVGLTLYDTLSMFRNIGQHQFLDERKTKEYFPELTLEGFRTAALYYDCQMDDSRIVLENALDASKLGAHIFNYCEVKGIEEVNSGRFYKIEAWDREQERSFSVHARKVVNATGPWSDFFAQEWRNQTRNYLRPTKGVHLVLPELEAEVAGFFPSIYDDDRLFFAIPWEGRTLLGTTDTEFDRNPDELYVSEDDREYLLNNLNHYLEEASFNESDIISEFAGLRPLYDPGGADKDESDVSREHEILKEGSIYSVVGGKYTTYRSIAAETLNNMEAPGKSTTDKRVLPGGWLNDEQSQKYRNHVRDRYDLSDRQVEEVLRRYGRRVTSVLETRKHFQDALEPVGENEIPLRAQVYFAVLQEGARKPEDVIRRRTNMFVQEENYFEIVERLMEKAIDHGDISGRLLQSRNQQ